MLNFHQGAVPHPQLLLTPICAQGDAVYLEPAIFNILSFNPNSHTHFRFLSPRKGRVQKMGVPPWFRTGGLLHHNALSNYGTQKGVTAWAAISIPYETPL